MNENDKKKLYESLAAPFPEEAIERTDGKVTGRGFSTTGIKYIMIVQRLNEVLGLGGWRAQRNITVTQTTTSTGRRAFEAVAEVTVQIGGWKDGDFAITAEAVADGGHTSMSEADARKGAMSNGLKKCAAMFGCGWQAYAGVIDDDNVAQEAASDGAGVRVPPSAPESSAAPKAVVTPSLSPPAGQDGRNRLTAKQLSALWAISKKLGIQPSEFRQNVKGQHGVQPEFLTRAQASGLISSMGNGHAHDGMRQPGMEG